MIFAQLKASYRTQIRLWLLLGINALHIKLTAPFICIEMNWPCSFFKLKSTLKKKKLAILDIK